MLPKLHLDHALVRGVATGIDLLAETSILAGEADGDHQHAARQFLVVLAGGLELAIPGATKPLPTGSAVHIPAGRRHRLRRPGPRRGRGFAALLLVAEVQDRAGGAAWRRALSSLPECEPIALPLADLDAHQRRWRHAIAMLHSDPGAIAPAWAALWQVLATCSAASDVSEQVDARVQAVENDMRKRLASDLSVTQLAAAVDLSVSQLERLFTSERGMGPARRLRELRLQQAQRLLRAGARRISDVALCCGIPDPARFSRQFRAYAGCTPSEWIARRSR